MRRTICFAVAVAVSVFLVSCSTPDSNQSETVTEVQDEPTSISTPSESPTPVPADSILLADCSTPALVNLEQLDPTSGAIAQLASFSVTGKTTFSPCGSWHLDSVVAPLLFDASFKRLAINWTDATTSALHVGWVDDTGVITDVTEAFTGGTGGFSAQPEHGNAMFDGAGNFAFVDYATGLLHRVAITTPSTDAVEPVNLGNKYGVVSVLFFISPNGVPHGARELDNTSSGSGIFLADGSEIASSSGDRITDIGPGNQLVVISTEEAPTIKFLPPGSFGDTDGDGRVETEDARDIAGITPPTDFVLNAAVVNPAASQIAFTGTRGQEYNLFVIPVGGGQPQILTALAPGKSLLKWIS